MTQKDQVLSKVLRFVLHGWPHARVEEELKPYFMRNELSHFDGCLLWGKRLRLVAKPEHSVREH